VSKIKSLGFEPKYDIRKGVEKTFNDIQSILKTGYREYQNEI
jgi:hypothetical protein